MNSETLSKHHLKSFQKLSMSVRLDWGFSHGQLLRRFMDKSALKLSNKMRRSGKKYYGE